MKPRNSRLVSFRIAAALITTTASLHAASGTWTGLTDSTWQENGNWSGASFPNGAGQTATFNGTGNGNTNVTLGGGSITLANFGGTGILVDTPSVASYAISNGTINTFQGGSIVRLNPTVVNNQSVTAGIVTDSQSVLYTTEAVLNYSPAARLTLGNLSVLSAATGTGSTTYSFRGLGDITVAGAITDNLSGVAPRLTAVANHRAATLVLSGANAFSGAFSGTDTPQSLSGGLGGTVVLDYSSGNAVLASGTSVTPGRSGSGNLVLKGNTTGTTSLTLSSTQRFAAGYSTITVDNNGGSGTTLTLGSDWRGWNTTGGGKMALFDLSGGGQVQTTGAISGGYSISRGIIRNSVGGSAVTVKGTDGKTYFATLDGSNFIVAQTSLTTMPTSGGGDFNINYQVTANTTLTGSGAFGGNTLRIEGASANQTLNLGGRSWNGAGAILMDGNQDFTITNYTNLTPTSGVMVMGSGKLTLEGTKTLGDFDKFGPGLLEVTGNHSASTGATWVWGGTYRASSANALTAGVLNMADGVLELGYDFTRALGGSAGQIRAREDAFASTQGASFGFSAYGGNRSVNLGGASAAVQFGTANFVGNRDAKLLLSSPSSDSTVDFQNPINLNNDSQTVEVRNGSAAVDARLSGILSNGSLIKTGAGTLELTAANTYAGTTVVGAGTLLVNGTNSGTGLVRVASGATLGGTGPLAAAVNAAGIIAPGNGVGTVTAGDVTLGGTLAVEINGASGDRLVSTGAIDLTGATLTVSLLGGGFTQPSYVIAEGSSLTGTFASVPVGYTVTYTATQAILSLSGPPANDYAAWLAANPPATGFNTDSDNDGVPNGLENILGTSPNVFSQGLTQISATPTSATFIHSVNATPASDVTRSYQWSTDLVEWRASGQTNAGGTTATITPSAPVAGNVTVTTAITAGPSGKLFTRLVATKAP